MAVHYARRGNLVGQRFGRLVVLRYSHTAVKGGCQRGFWLCHCDCGRECSVNGSRLRRGGTRSCGCIRIRHGHTQRGRRTPEWQAWYAMQQRCYQPGATNYHQYGGRGIKVCERWLACFENFLADVGLRPSSKYSLDRIDNDGHYEPGNCRWATRKDQRANQRKRARLDQFTDEELRAELARRARLAKE
jgi:hypothetical protein